MCGTQEDLAAITGCVRCQVVACVLVDKPVAELQDQRGKWVDRAVKAHGKLAILRQIAVPEKFSCMQKIDVVSDEYPMRLSLKVALWNYAIEDNNRACMQALQH